MLSGQTLPLRGASLSCENENHPFAKSLTSVRYGFRIATTFVVTGYDVFDCGSDRHDNRLFQAGFGSASQLWVSWVIASSQLHFTRWVLTGSARMFELTIMKFLSSFVNLGKFQGSFCRFSC